jgi:arylsulfatase A-like enzyme
VFLFVGLTDTHSPFTDHPQHLVDHYVANPVKSVKVEKYTGNATRVPGKMPLPNEHQRRMAQYAASVETIDQCVGRVLDHLTALGTANNTAVLYTGDHGHMNGHHGLYYKGNATIPQNFYDESIRVPCVWRMPGKSAAGQVSRSWVNHCDQFETILELASVSRKHDVELNPGISLLPTLLGKANDTRDIAICEYGNAQMIRTSKLKVIKRFGRGLLDEAYDLINDPRETTNVIENVRNSSDYTAALTSLTNHFNKFRFAGLEGFTGSIPKHNGGEPWSGI